MSWCFLEWLCFWLKVISVIKCHRVHDWGRNRRLGEKDMIYDCLFFFCMFLYTCLYSAMSAFTSIFEPNTQSPFDLLKKRVITSYTRNFDTWQCTSLNNLPGNALIFLNKKNHWFVYTIMASNCNAAQSHFPDITKTWGRQVVLKSVKSAVRSDGWTEAVQWMTKWPALHCKSVPTIILPQISETINKEDLLYIMSFDCSAD